MYLLGSEAPVPRGLHGPELCILVASCEPCTSQSSVMSGCCTGRDTCAGAGVLSLTHHRAIHALTLLQEQWPVCTDLFELRALGPACCQPPSRYLPWLLCTCRTDCSASPLQPTRRGGSKCVLRRVCMSWVPPFMVCGMQAQGLIKIKIIHVAYVAFLSSSWFSGIT